MLLFWKSFARRSRFTLVNFTYVGVWGVENGKQEPSGEQVSTMRSLLVRCSIGRLTTVFSQSTASQNKLATRAVAVPRLYCRGKSTHYETEERGHPNSLDYRIYFSKLSILTIIESIVVSYIYVTGTLLHIWPDKFDLQVKVWPYSYKRDTGR